MRTVTVTKEIEAQVDDTYFLEVMGKSPINKVLDFLIDKQKHSWTMKDISEGRNVGYSTLKILLPKMVENGLIKIERVVGKIKYYRINKDNELVKHVCQMHKAIYRKLLEEMKNQYSGLT